MHPVTDRLVVDDLLRRGGGDAGGLRGDCDREGDDGGSQAHDAPAYGGGGIRTLGTGVTRTTVFETAPFNHSGTPPGSCEQAVAKDSCGAVRAAQVPDRTSGRCVN